MRKGLKILFRLIGGIIILVILLIVSIPLFFKDEVTEAVRRAIDQKIEGAFYFQEADLGILKSFPNLCLDLTKPVLTGAPHPAGDSLFTAKSLGVIIDIMSVIHKDTPIKIVGVTMDEPRISIYVDTSGTTNYELVSSADTTSASQDSLVVEIESYTINGGSLRYIDRGSGVDILAKELEHKGSLRYQGNQIELKSRTNGGKMSLSSDGLQYMDEVNIQGVNDLDIDLEHATYRLLENHVSLNALEVDIDGSVGVTDVATTFDLTFDGQRNSFKNLISLLPNMYSNDFEHVNASGNIALSGTLKGELTNRTTPVYDVRLSIDNGAFQVPNAPFGFKETACTAALHNSTQNWLPVDIEIAGLHFLLNGKPFRADIAIRNPTGQATYKGQVNGSLDLSDFVKAYPLDQVKTLQGLVSADIKFNLDAMKPKAEQYAEGSISLTELFAATEEERISVPQATLEFSPEAMQLAAPTGEWNDSGFSANASVRDYIGWLTRNEPMLVKGDFRIDKLDLNRYLDSSSDTSLTAPTVVSPGLELIRFEGSIAAGTFIYESYVITNGVATVQGTLPKLEVLNTRGDINGTHFDARGQFTDLHTYLNGSSPLTGKLSCTLDNVYVDRWIEEDSTENTAATSDAQSEYVALPRDINLDIDFTANRLTYDNIKIEAPRGNMKMEDGILSIHEFRGRGMNGDISFSGLYNTQNVAHPGFSMKYDLKGLHFADAFEQIETFQALAPIVKSIKGVFNSVLVFEGRLGDNYMPDFNSLSASGFLETLNGTLQQTAIFEKLSQFLNLKEALHMDLANTKNWFEVKDGYVILQEASKNVNGIELSYGGKHQIQGDMDYLIKMNIPAEKVSSNPVGALAKAGYEQLQSKAAAYGVKLATIDHFIVHVGVRGKLADPKFDIQLFDASGKSLKDVAAEQLESVKEQLRDTITAVANEKIEAVRDSIKSVIDVAVDSARRAAEEKLKEAGKEVIGDAAAKLDSTLRDSITNAILNQVGNKVLEGAGQKETDKIKDALDKWDPFKKKKNQDP